MSLHMAFPLLWLSSHGLLVCRLNWCDIMWHLSAEIFRQGWWTCTSYPAADDFRKPVESACLLMATVQFISRLRCSVDPRRSCRTSGTALDFAGCYTLCVMVWGLSQSQKRNLHRPSLKSLHSGLEAGCSYFGFCFTEDVLLRFLLFFEL